MLSILFWLSSSNVSLFGVAGWVYSVRAACTSDPPVLELDQLVYESMERCADGRWRCLVCHFSNNHKARVKNHVETHMDSQQFCPVCQQACKSRDSLRKHMSRLHRGDEQF